MTKTAWWALQIAIFAGIVYVYTSNPEMMKNATLGHVVLFGFIIAFGVTWLISRRSVSALFVTDWPYADPLGPSLRR